MEYGLVQDSFAWPAKSSGRGVGHGVHKQAHAACTSVQQVLEES